MEFPSATVFDQPKGKAEWGGGGGLLEGRVRRGTAAAAVAMVTPGSHQWLFGLMGY